MDVLLTLLAVECGLGLRWIITRKYGNRSANITHINTSLESMRAVGELSVFKVVSKEFVTETDDSFGEFGRKYLRGAFSQKRLAMIFEFQIDFRDDLRSSQFSITTTDSAAGRFAPLNLPPVRAEISVRSVRFYNE